jgi:hypothetical protein
MERTEAENIAKELADYCRAEVGRDQHRAAFYIGERVEAATYTRRGSFTLPDGTAITIEVRVNPAGRLDPRAAVALKLAEAFGMKVPEGKSTVEPLVARAA